MSTSEAKVKSKLEKLHALGVQKELVLIEKQTLLDEIIPAEIREKIAEVEAEFATRLETVDATIAALRSEITSDVIELGKSVKGDHFHAIYAAGKKSWDTTKLEGFSAAHPEIKEFLKVGNPSASIRSL